VNAYIHEFARTRAPSSLTERHSRLRRYLSWAGEQTPASAWSRPHLQRYHLHVTTTPKYSLNAKDNPPPSPRTCNRLVNAVHLLWEWADEYAEDLNWEIARPRRITLPTVPEAEVVAASWSQTAAVLRYARDHQRRDAYRTAVLLRCTGLRVGAAFWLRWDDLDLTHERMHVRAVTTKGGYGGREVPLAPVLAAELAGWGRREGYVLSGDKCNAVRAQLGVVAPDKSRRYLAWLRTAWKGSKMSVSLWKQRPAHAFRISLTSCLAAEGVDREIGELLVGHEVAGSRRRYLDKAARWTQMVKAVSLIPDWHSEDAAVPGYREVAR